MNLGTEKQGHFRKCSCLITFHSIDTRLCIKYRTGDRKLCLVCIYRIHMTKDSAALWSCYAVLITSIKFFDGTRWDQLIGAISLKKNWNNRTDLCERGREVSGSQWIYSLFASQETRTSLIKCDVQTVCSVVLWCCARVFLVVVLLNKQPVTKLLQQIVSCSLPIKHTNYFGCRSCSVSGFAR